LRIVLVWRQQRVSSDTVSFCTHIGTSNEQSRDFQKIEMSNDTFATPGAVLRIANDAHWSAVREQCRLEGKILVADFGATWCGPCKRIYPKYEELCQVAASDDETRELFVFVKVDIDQCRRVAAEEGATSVPLFKTYYNDSVIHSARGSNPEQLRAMLEAAHEHWRDLQDSQSQSQPAIEQSQQ